MPQKLSLLPSLFMAFRPPTKLMVPLCSFHMVPSVDLRQLRAPERPCLGTPCPSFCRRGSRKALIRTVFADEAGRGRYSRLMCDKTSYIEPDIHPMTRRIRVNPHTLALTWIVPLEKMSHIEPVAPAGKKPFVRPPREKQENGGEQGSR